jgi:ribosome biogenesis ATPase
MGAGPLTAAELAGLAITMTDFERALPKVQPSVRREGFTTKPDATWEDVGSLEEVRREGGRQGGREAGREGGREGGR